LINSRAQPNYTYALSGTGGAKWYACATADGGWITGAREPGPPYHLVRFDKCGLVQWSKILNYTYGELKNIASSHDGGFLVLNDGMVDLKFVKLAHDGNVKFGKVITHPSMQLLGANFIQSDPSGNIYIGGLCVRPDGMRPLVVKLDSLGNLIWSKIYDGTFQVYYALLNDGFLTCSGGQIYKCDTSGSVTWAITGVKVVGAPLALNDGVIFLTQDSSSIFSLIKISLSGDFLWQSTGFPYYYSHDMGKLAVSKNGTITAGQGHHILNFSPSGKFIKCGMLQTWGFGGWSNDIATLADSSLLLATYGNSGQNFRFQPPISNSCGIAVHSDDTLAAAPIVIGDTSAVSSNIQLLVNPIVASSSISLFGVTELCKVDESMPYVSFAQDSICINQFSASVFPEAAAEGFNTSWHQQDCNGPSPTFTDPLDSGPAIFYASFQGCDTSACIPWNVIVTEAPHAGFNVEFLSSCDGIVASIKDNASPGAISWFVNNTYAGDEESLQIEIDPALPLFIRQVKTSSICSDTSDQSFSVAQLARLGSAEFPNIFTPNGDNINDTFQPLTNTGQCYRMEIFDRWGNLLFHSDGSPWDGSINGKAANSGIYYYTFTTMGRSGQGFFMLER
jgi:gliding motility-associated-like protein